MKLKLQGKNKQVAADPESSFTRQNIRGTGPSYLDAIAPSRPSFANILK